MRYGLEGFREVGGRRPLFCAQAGALVRKETRMKALQAAALAAGLAILVGSAGVSPGLFREGFEQGCLDMSVLN